MKPENPNDLEQRLSRLYAAPVPESFETGWRADVRREESLQSMKKWNGKPMWKRLAPAMCALVLVAGALWTGTLNNEVNLAADQTAYTMVTSSRSVSGSSNGMNAKYSLMASEPAEYEEAAAYDMAAGYDMGVTTYGAVQQTERKLVRTADLTIRTAAFDDALAQVQDQLSAMGGYVENLYQYGETTRRISLTMRVPSEKLDDFLLSLEGAGKVTDRSESTTDMTTEYQDNEARLNTLYEKRDRLNELLAKAENVSDLIEIESAIADTQYQIDRYETSQRSIDRQVDMSQVYLTLMEQEQTVVNPELTLAERIRAGFESSVEWLVGFGRDMVVFVVMASPVIGIGAALWLVWKLIRKLKKREE